MSMTWLDDFLCESQSDEYYTYDNEDWDEIDNWLEENELDDDWNW